MDASPKAASSSRSSSLQSKIETEQDRRERTTVRVWRRQDLVGAGRLVCHFWNWLILNTWCPEVIAMLLSIACTIAIITVLQIYEGEAIPNLPYGITLNAIISILATAAKTSLLYLVASAMSQLKWCWFQRDRPLQDIQSFDDASRGPWGSAILLFELRWKSFASIGAIVTVLALAFDPFVQQVLKYPPRQHADPSKSETVKAVKDFVAWKSYTNLIGSIEAGIWSKPELLRLTPSCPSGNCKWQEYSSFEWCSKCADTTNLASVHCAPPLRPSGSQNCSFSLEPGNRSSRTFPTGDHWPCGLDYWSNDMESVWPIYEMSGFSPRFAKHGPSTYASHPNATYLGIRSPLLVIGHAAWTAWGKCHSNITQTFIRKAEQCVLTPCLKHYKVSVLHGRPVVEVKAEGLGNLNQYGWSYAGGGFMSTFCWNKNGARLSYAELSSTFGEYKNISAGIICSRAVNDDWDSSVGVGYVYWIAQRLTGNAQHKYWSWNDPSSSVQDVKIDIPDLWTEADDIVRAAAKHNLSHIIGNLAESLSQGARGISDEMVPGWVYRDESFVRVRWAWMILPIVLDVAGLTVLITAILSSRYHKARLWKESLLPLLYHGMEKEERLVATDIHGMEQLARHDVVSLDQSSADRIVLQRVLPIQRTQVNT